MYPRRSEIIYSCKCFGGAMLALYAAMAIGLPRPFWAMMTAYIVANPLAGTVRSKALYRCLGTVVGSAATVLMVPRLANSPELLSLALALWVGLCLYISLLDRTPRSYLFMLAGYTAGLIGFPVVSDPGTVFDVALARSEEITLGIVCASLVHTLVLPQSLGTALLARVNRTVADANNWARSTLQFAGLPALQPGAASQPGTGDAVSAAAAAANSATSANPAPPATSAAAAADSPVTSASTSAPPSTDAATDASSSTSAAAGQAAPAEPAVVVDAWRKLAADITELRLMATHLPFDTSSLRWMSGTVHALHDRLALLVPLLLSIEDRLRTLDVIDPASLTPEWRQLADDIGRWIGDSRLESGPPDAGRAAQLRKRIEAFMPALQAQTSWSTLLRLNLAVRLRSLVETAEESLVLQHQLDAMLHGRRPQRALRLDATSTWGLHLDHGMALRSAFAAVIAITACCAFWILTGWPSGSAAAMLSAVFCCFFAGMDDPAPNIQTFLNYTIYSIPLSALYLLGILPAIHSFEMFVMAMAPALLAIGIFLSRPAYMGKALALIFGICGTLSLQDTGSSDMVSFTNGMLAQICGVFAAVLFTRLLRSATAQQIARRLMSASRRELVQISGRQRAPNLLAVSTLMLDRIALLAPRLAISGARADPSAFAALTDLRVGLNMAQLRHLQAGRFETRPVFRPAWRSVAAAQARLLQDIPARLSAYPRLRSRRPSLQQRAHSSALPLEKIRLDVLMEQLHAMFRDDGSQDAAPQGRLPALLATLDRTLHAVIEHAGGTAREQAAAALVSIRRDLFPGAPPYLPQSPDLPLPNPQIKKEAPQ